MSTDINTLLDRIIDSLLEHGWQPADLVHATKRQFNQRTSRLIAHCLAVHARRMDAPGRAPDEWLRQLAALGVYHPGRGTITGGASAPVAAWAKQEKVHPDDVHHTAVEVCTYLRTLGRLPTVLPVPSAWPATNKGRRPVEATDAGDVDPKTLERVRALLAKAESTDFEAEAEAFTAKAQELMTKHSIDMAMLAAAAAGAAGARRGIVSRRVHIDDPYADEKSVFLAAISRANGVRAVWSPQAGFTTVMGYPVDVQLTDLLFTSLLVQATRASAEATASDKSLRTASFKRAFLISYANRVAERLDEARTHVAHQAEQEYGNALVPVLAQREAALDAAYQEAFPNVIMRPGRRLNADGWYAGRAAAERADIGAGAALPSG